MTTNDSLQRPVTRVALVTAALLMVPLVAMRVGHEVVWTPFDFAVAGTLLFGTGLAIELLVRRSRNLAYRLGAALGVGSALFLVWANLAVGVIGSERNPANLMYLGVLAIGIALSAGARFEARGMARALFAMAGAQAAVAVIALAFGLGGTESGPLEIVWTNGMFVALFGASALLFRSAARKQAGAGTSPRR